MSDDEPVTYVVAARPSYRDLYDELATLRQEMAEVKAELARSMRRVGEHDEPCPFDNPAPTWQGGKCVKPRGHETHWNGQGDVWRVCIEELVAERDALDKALIREHEFEKRHVAELAALRPVVEAAKAWRKGYGRIAFNEHETETHRQWRRQDQADLAAAVDALDVLDGGGQ
jgi:hypothetical protein